MLKNASMDRAAWFRGAMVLLVVVGLSFKLGEHALVDPDEGRNAAIAREMMESGDLLLPTLNGLPFLDKPFLFFAVDALSLRLFGVSELGARLPSLLFALATALLTAWFAAHLFGRRAAWVAGLSMATAPLVVVMSRTVIFDSMLSFFIVLAVIAFYLAVEAQRASLAGKARLWSVVAWLAMALGMLTKGPVALAIPLLVALPFALRHRCIGAVLHSAGLGFHLAVVVPAVWALESRVPGFLHYALVTETWQRLTTDELRRTGPVWYFLPYLLGGAFPWTFAALAGGWVRLRETRRGRESSAFLFLVLWLFLPLLFFSLSQSKRPQYILPILPVVALFMAWAWQAPRSRLYAIRAASLGWLVVSGILLVGGCGSLATPRNADAVMVEAIHSTAGALGLLALFSGLAAWLYASWAPQGEIALAALCMPLIFLPWLGAPLADEIAEQRSGKVLAKVLAPHVEAGVEIVGIETFSPSLRFYLGSPVLLSSLTGEPLGSNYILRFYDGALAAQGSTLRAAGWWHQPLAECPSPRIFMIQPRHVSELHFLEDAGLPLLFENRKFLVYGPCAP